MSVGEIRDLPILPIKNNVIFPVLAFPISVQRPKTIAAVEKALSGDRMMAIFSQKDANVQEPEKDDLHQVGSLVKIIKNVKMPGNKLSVVIQGVSRILMRDFNAELPYLSAEVEVVEEEEPSSLEIEEKREQLRELAQKVFDLSPQVPSEASFLVRSTASEISKLADVIAININIENEERQELLSTIDVEERVDKVLALLNKEIQVLELSNKIQSKVKGEMDKAQREYFLREQMKAIQRELDETDEKQDEFDDLKLKIKQARMPEDVEKVAIKEFKRMNRMNPSSAEFTVSRTYLDWLVELPWSVSTEDVLDIQKAAEILDEDHFGLEKVKKRILEFLAVRKLKNDMKGPILCLVGPPGVGKTSLAKSVSRAMGRKMVRISLGGVRDESEIRGHRRTYIGSMPGKIIKSIKKSAANNPVFVLDEIDKLGSDHRGDPSSALLEVLDPEQNDTFQDHYLDVTFDLSKVMFIATANLASPIPGPLRDRMEIIEIAGYTIEEKLQICKRYIIPEQVKEHGITGSSEYDKITEDDSSNNESNESSVQEHVYFEDEGIRFLIESYTREAGVRNLKREIASLCRSVAKEVASDTLEKTVVMNEEKIEDTLGPIRFFNDVAERTAVSGVATGLAWTAVGGDILFIEATKMPGKGQMKLSGSLGDVMKESVGVASSYVRSTAEQWGISSDVFENNDIHIHVPSGAIPKDGPSAGVTMLTAIVSLLTGIKVDAKMAMSGEATLRGAVLPVGGIKEKVLAAHRAGIRTVILPSKNQKDLPEIPEDIRSELEIHFCSRMEEVLAIALGQKNIDAFKSKMVENKNLLED
jgi:ATP-dependent Lon protease